MAKIMVEGAAEPTPNGVMATRKAIAPVYPSLRQIPCESIRDPEAAWPSAIAATKKVVWRANAP